MTTETSRKCADITVEMIKCFLINVQDMTSKIRKVCKKIVSKSSLLTQMSNQCQMDLIDMQAQADCRLKFTMDTHSTKFVLLQALQIKRPEKVTHQTYFLCLAPCIVH